jgi:RNA polymerase sigma-70 factor (ECF subfamily)
VTKPVLHPTPIRSSEHRSDERGARVAPLWSDDRALERIRAGDAGVFDALVRGLGPALCTFAARYVGPDDAQELVQDVLVNVWMRREEIVVRDTVKTYLYRAVRNRALNVTRDQAARRGALARIEWAHAADRDSEPALAEPEAHLQSAQLAAAVRAAVDRLPPRWKLAFELVREHQLTYAEAAAVMGVTIKSVDMSLGRAVKALRESLRGVWP